MTVRKIGFEDYQISDIINGHLCEKRYMYYTEKEAKCLFEEEYKDQYELEREGELDMEDWEE